MRKVVLIALVLLLVVTVVPAAAKTKPLGVEIEVTTTIPGGGPFIATGPAVDAGVICGSGDVITRFGALRSPPPPLRTLSILNEFACDDGSGSFFIKVEVKFTDDGTTGNWVVLDGTSAHGEIEGDMDGTGAYTELRGRGKLIGFPIVPGVSILDVYSGQLH